MCLAKKLFRRQQMKTHRLFPGHGETTTRGHFYCGECGDISPQKLMTETAALPLSCRSFDDLESQSRGFPLKRVDLTVAVLSLVEVRASVDKLHSVAQHAIHESG